jgi:nitrite reductase/ring-hydroxylating ferredoxin subunit/multimeric flavodoxin WrbA
MAAAKWHDLGDVATLRQKPLQQLMAGRTAIALTYKDRKFSAVSGVCNHAGGPLGEGRLDGNFIVCPWHNYKFDCTTGEGEPGFEADRVPSHETKIEQGRLLVNLTPLTPRHKLPHPPHPLARTPKRAAGPVRVAGISTTVMDAANPRFSASDHLLEAALAHAGEKLACETRLIKLNDLKFRACEGYYSKAAAACTWPCSITQMDEKDQLDRVYEALVHWADVLLVSTPIRWGSASSLYYKMVERMNCIQNQITTHDRVLIRDKVAGFIIMGGQDNIQAVAGQMLGFFGEIGFHFPQFPYIAHSRGWTAEDMERNNAIVSASDELREGAQQLAARAVGLASRLLAGKPDATRMSRGGRKAHPLADKPG